MGAISKRKTAAALLSVAPLAVAMLVASSCAPAPEDGRLTTLKTRPDEGAFKTGNVSYFLERRCGTLDCHGRLERPLRIYGAYGLRLPNDAGIVPSDTPATAAEQTANYRSVLGLEPEQLNRVMTGDDPNILLLISKPLAYDPERKETQNGVRHRGGPQIIRNQDGYRCLYDWLKGAFTDASAQACRTAGDALAPK
ncbi:hypothetical protein [Pendulispora albinea]|uniref:Lipoprotein n=1 Tax=Pendulispora albinea TaxID=2741071 RepID=A0ABZ2LQT1_9BACT